MKPVAKWCAVVAGVVALGLGSSALFSSHAQETPNAKKIEQKAKAEKSRQEKIAALKNAVEHSPTTLAQAIATAEAESSGKAFAAEMEMEHGKFIVSIDLVVGDKITEVNVATETGKVITAKMGDDDDDDEGDDDDDDDDDDDGDDDGK